MPSIAETAKKYWYLILLVVVIAAIVISYFTVPAVKTEVKKIEQSVEKEFHKLKLPDTIREMDLHPDGIQVATAHFDGHVRICKLAPKAT